MSTEADALSSSAGAVASQAVEGDLSGAASSAAFPFSHTAADTAPTSTMATAMLFGTIIFACTALASRTWLTGDGRAMRSALDPRSSPLDPTSFRSIYCLLHHSAVFGCILMFAYVCEYHPPFPHSEKSYDRDEFMFLMLLLALASAYTVQRNDGSDQKKKGGGGSAGTMAAGEANGGTTDATRNRAENGGGSHSSGSSEGVGEGRHSGSFSASRRRSSSSSSAADVKACNDVLNRDQTEEWKGWMQYAFLLYHYFHAEEVYNSIRVMITCYVWMTGFGNFSFFYLKGDYSFVRFLQMLWRLNFLVIFLMLSQGTTYILYYICPLHTYFFILVYATMRIGRHLNYTKYGMRFKLACVALLIFVLWDVDTGLFQLVHFPFLGNDKKLGATNGTMWEWYFRSSLDHWSTFLGMVFALNFPITSLFYRKLESRGWQQEWLGKGIVGVALLAALALWVSGPFQRSKVEYNATNSYFGFIPLITFIYLRNLTPGLRSHSLNLLHQIGKTTLETYLMQHHIWLTSDAKSLLTLIPGWPKANMLVVSVIYFYTSRRLYKLTLYLRGMLLPDKDLATCVRSLGAMVGSIGVFYAVALVLESFGLASLTAVAVISASCGMLLYQTVVDATWSSYREGATQGADDDDRSLAGSVLKAGIAVSKSDSSVARASAPLIASMVLLVMGLTWHGMAETGAGKIKPLRTECDAFVNDGAWIPVDGCDETGRGEAYRLYGIGSFATCGAVGPSYVWGWNATTSSTHCRFARRDAKKLRAALGHRSMVYIGDSMTRNLYYATLRSMGVAEAGRYDATMPKHSDVFNTVGSASVDFRWAPLAVDQLSALRDINGKVSRGTGPDLIVMGGGTWDRLHVYATDEDQKSHRATVSDLAEEMRTSVTIGGSPVAWLVPTSINTPALNTEDKRDHMREEDMDRMRAVYRDAGVLSSASFVLDGPSFTHDRVEEAYDGVHYPPQVYDAGAQILANALDWLLPQDRDVSDPFRAPQPGRMANPFLGMMMLCLVFIGLMFFDGFMGFSYLAALFVKGVMPNDLYDEAFIALHRKMKLPAIKGSGSSRSGRSRSAKTPLPTLDEDAVTEGGDSSWGSAPVGAAARAMVAAKAAAAAVTGGGSSSPGGDRGVMRRSNSPPKHSTLDEEIAALLAEDGSVAGSASGSQANIEMTGRR